MKNTGIKKQVENYLPMLSSKQQILVLEMIKSFLNIENASGRISQKQYSQEINEAVAEIDKGKYLSHKDALKELSEWWKRLLSESFGDYRL